MSTPYFCTYDLTGINYKNFLDLALKSCCEATVIIRSNLNVKADDIIKRLKRFEIETRIVNRWPGTGRDIYDKKDFPTSRTLRSAEMLKFHFNVDSIEILKIADSLFSWNGSHFPDDLCLYKSSGKIWLTLTGHERIAALQLEENEYKEFCEIFPGLLVTENNFYKNFWSEKWAKG